MPWRSPRPRRPGIPRSAAAWRPTRLRSQPAAATSGSCCPGCRRPAQTVEKTVGATPGPLGSLTPVGGPRHLPRMANEPGPSVTLPWLVRLRWLSVLGQAVAVGLADRVLKLGLESELLAAIVSLAAASNLALGYISRYSRLGKPARPDGRRGRVFRSKPGRPLEALSATLGHLVVKIGRASCR